MLWSQWCAFFANFRRKNWRFFSKTKVMSKKYFTIITTVPDKAPKSRTLNACFSQCQQTNRCYTILGFFLVNRICSTIFQPFHWPTIETSIKGKPQIALSEIHSCQIHISGFVIHFAPRLNRFALQSYRIARFFLLKHTKTDNNICTKQPQNLPNRQKYTKGQ
jgi:hypothetical protein